MNKLISTLTELLLTTVVLGGVAMSAAAWAGEGNDVCDSLAASPYDMTRPAGLAGVEPGAVDAKTALAPCRAAYENDKTNPRMAFQLARVLDRTVDKPQAKALYEQAAKAGHVAAMVNLGVALEDTAPAEAFALYGRAAATGHVLGEFNLGVAYRNGIGTPVDAAQAITWFKKASDQGDGMAAYDLGVLSDEGKLVPENNADAVVFYMLAAERGIVDAMINLAMMREEGDGIAVDKAAALVLFQKAADRGDVDGIDGVKRLKAAAAAP